MRRVVLCLGSSCKDNGPVKEMYDRLCGLLGHPNPFGDPETGIKWTVSSCLNYCDLGPNLAVFDEKGDGTWYNHLDPAALEAIIAADILPYLKKPQP